MINTILATFKDKDTEKSYRQAYLKPDAIQAVTGVIVFMLPAVAFLYSDYLLFGTTGQFYRLMVVRLIYILFSAVIIALLLKSTSSTVMDYSLALYLAVLIITLMYINMTRPRSYVHFVFVDIIVVASIYVFFMSRLLFQFILAMFFTVIDTVYLVFLSADVSPITQNAIVISYVVANVLGGFTSLRLHLYRRRQYHAYIKEREMKDELRAALDSVKTLSGLLPICSSCKKVRDDKGYWTQLEKYLEIHADAQVSHSLCEECAEKLYGSEPWFRK